jgi:hypothetical protein
MPDVGRDSVVSSQAPGHALRIAASTSFRRRPHRVALQKCEPRRRTCAWSIWRCPEMDGTPFTVELKAAWATRVLSDGTARPGARGPRS